ncbi:PiggyBac transposable element-derived protein 3, partial [Trichinella sp. T9]
MRAIGTIRPCRSNGADAVMLPDKQLMNQKRGGFDFRNDGNVYIAKWHDSAIVRIASNFLTNRPLRNTQRRVKGQRIEVQMPNIVRSYNTGVGGIDYLDRIAAAYRPTIRSKKLYWFLFINVVNVATVAAWRIHRFVEERPHSHLELRRQVVLSLLQSERTATPRVASGFMSQLPDIRFDGVNHILGTGLQGRCKVCKQNTKNMCKKCNKKVKMLMALAFLPVHLVSAGFEIINVGTSSELEALFQYFQQEWLSATKIKLWNVHGVSVRTNNHLEGWHSRMNKRARKHHLGFYQFLQLILDEQGKTETVVRQIDDGYTHGRGSVRRSAAYGVQQRRVAALTGKLVHNEITVEHFLSEISYHTPEPLRL